MIMKTGQLHTYASKDFKIYRATDSNGKAVTFNAGKKPLLTWPDGHWCMEVSHYLTRCVRQSLSMADRGGTLGTYAFGLSHIVRYAFSNRCDFIDFTDSHFSLFVRSLCAEKVMKNGALERARDDNTVIELGRLTLDFLSVVGDLHGRPQLVGEDGIIKVHRKINFVKNGSGQKKIAVKSWTHPSFPKPAARKKRRPISDDYICKLRAAILSMGGSNFMRRRRFVLLRCLEKTGGRRIEIAQLKVSDVKAAFECAKRGEKPFIKMATFKKRSKMEHRYIPLNSLELNMLMEFIKFYLGPVLLKTKQSHDYIFVDENTGLPIAANTITNEVSEMRKTAGIQGKASPHLFRHKYITDLMKGFIMEFKISDKNAFLDLSKKMGSLKERVLNYTGHADVSSLDDYIDYAFMDVEEMDELEQRVDIQNLAESSDTAIAELRRMEKFLTPEEFARLAMKTIEALNMDLTRGRPAKRGEK
jgi:integrase